MVHTTFGLSTHLWEGCLLAAFLRRRICRHMNALVVSVACYFAAFAIMQHVTTGQKTIAANAARIVLWYLPIVLELPIHSLDSDFSDHTVYSSKIIYQRASGILYYYSWDRCVMYLFPSAYWQRPMHQGLDTIVGGLQYLVGTLAVGVRNVGPGLAVLSSSSDSSLYISRGITRRSVIAPGVF